MRKKLLIGLALLSLLVIGVTQTKAENSAQGYEPHIRSGQVFASYYNNWSGTIAVNAPVILDIGNGTDGSTKGAYITTSATTDSIFAVGVADEAIGPGKLGRICIRGPHKIALVSNGLGALATGSIITTSTTINKGAIYSTADGTAGGQLGYILSVTASTDTGDTADTYWAWLNPRVHK